MLGDAARAGVTCAQVCLREPTKVHTAHVTWVFLERVLGDPHVHGDGGGGGRVD
jgi:hypothetical protein